METIEKINFADFIPINQPIVKEDKIFAGDWVYPTEYATIRRPDFEAEFEHRAQKVESAIRTNIPIGKYPHSSHILHVNINGVTHKYYSSALRKIWQ